MNHKEENVIGEVDTKELKKKVPEHYRVPNIVRAYDTEYYLNDDEMAVLVVIGCNACAWKPNITKTNVEYLYSEIKWDLSHKGEGKKRIIKALYSLEDKGYIRIEYKGKEIKKDTKLTIHNVNEDFMTKTKVKVDGTTFSGYVQVTQEMIDLAWQGKSHKLGQRLKVFTHIAWRSSAKIGDTKKKYSISLAEWANILSVADSTVSANLDAMEDEGVIEVLHGEYIRNEDGTFYYAEDGRKKQERNTYFLQGEKPVVAEGYKPNVHKKHIRDKAIDKAIKKIMAEGEPRIAERPQLVMFGELPEVDDIAIFLTTESETLVKMAREKFAVLMGGKEKRKRDNAREILFKNEREVRSWFEGGNEDKIKRSIFNLDNPNLSKNEQEMTPDELKAKVDIAGCDNDYDEDDFNNHEINSPEDVNAIVERAKSNTVEEKKKSLFESEEWLEKKERKKCRYE